MHTAKEMLCCCRRRQAPHQQQGRPQRSICSWSYAVEQQYSVLRLSSPNLDRATQKPQGLAPSSCTLRQRCARAEASMVALQPRFSTATCAARSAEAGGAQARAATPPASSSVTDTLSAIANPTRAMAVAACRRTPVSPAAACSGLRSRHRASGGRHHSIAWARSDIAHATEQTKASSK